MNALTSAIERANAKATSVHQRALRVRMAGGLPLASNADTHPWSNQMNARRSKIRYGQFHGWLYSAVNAVAGEGAQQPVRVGRLVGASSSLPDVGPNRSKRQYSVKKIPKTVRSKVEGREWELIEDHPLLVLLDRPNPIQSRWEFAYSFITNLCLTGWSFVVWGQGEKGQLEVYSMPTDWVTPKHDNGPFSSFLIGNPNDANTSRVELGPDKVAMARMPSPSDPLGAMAPADSQQPAIRVDDQIQASQELFFENGVFPSVIVQIGKDPHPEITGGIRPRLNAPQRRQVISAIKSTMAGVANYGNPAIVDGLIESIDKLSMTQNELGWEKSENTIRTRILSTFGVHPFILGEIVNVGGYAQAREIKERFFNVVNRYLDMLSCVMSKLAEPMQDSRGKLYIWWEALEAKDPMIESLNLRYARKLGDITPDEFRCELGLPPKEEKAETRPAILDTPGGIQGVSLILGQVSRGEISRESAIQMLVLFLQVSEEVAEEIVGEEQEEPEPAEIPPQFQIPPPANDQEEQQQENEEGDEDQNEMETIREVVRLLRLDPVEVSEKVVQKCRER